MARLLKLAFLGGAVFAHFAGAVRTVSAEAKDAAAPPKAEVEAGLVAAQGHVTAKESATAEALQSATDSVAAAQKAMTDALMSHDTVATKAAYEAFEKAIAAKKEAEEAASGAKQLHEMVKTHNAVVDRYFDAVAQFMRTQAQKDETRQLADAKDLQDAKQVAEERAQKDNRLEIAGMAAVLNMFMDLLESAKRIRVKDVALGSPGVHAAVQEGLRQVQRWASGETHVVCVKYGKSTDPKVAEVRATVVGWGGKLDCTELIMALAREMPVQA